MNELDLDRHGFEAEFAGRGGAMETAAIAQQTAGRPDRDAGVGFLGIRARGRLVRRANEHWPISRKSAGRTNRVS